MVMGVIDNIDLVLLLLESLTATTAAISHPALLLHTVMISLCVTIPFRKVVFRRSFYSRHKSDVNYSTVSEKM